MNEHIIFTDSPPRQVTVGIQEIFVIEAFDFGQDDLYAAHVRSRNISEQTARERLSEQSRVIDVYANVEAELLTAPRPAERDDSKQATIGEIRDLHQCPTNGGTGDGVHVVAVDSGVDQSHPELKEADITQDSVAGKSDPPDAIGHGTAVMGQIHRIAPKAKLSMLRIFGESGRTSLIAILRAYQWLFRRIRRIDVVNMSFGMRVPVEPLDMLHDRLSSNGVRDVVAAGNTGQKSGSPATADNAMSVGSVDDGGKLSEFSSYNPKQDNPDVCGVGENTRLLRAQETSMGTPQDEYYTVASGTSFSSPLVAGMVAKYMSATDTHDPATILSDFESTAQDIPKTPRDGAGYVAYHPLVDGSDEPEPPTDDKQTRMERLLEWLFDIIYR